MSVIEIIVPGQPVCLNPTASGFAHGFGLFETMCLREGRLELWQAHWQRLSASARKLGIACAFDPGHVLDQISILSGDLAPKATIKLSLLKEAEASRLFIYSRPLAPIPESIGLLLDGPIELNENSPLAGLKTHSYLENVLVLDAARSLNCYDAVRLNRRGHLVEGAISNIFFHREGGWHTPGRESGLLPGVVRAALLELLPVEEAAYTCQDLLCADGVYLTNSSVGLLPVDWLHTQGQAVPLPSRGLQSYRFARKLLFEYMNSHATDL